MPSKKLINVKSMMSFQLLVFLEEPVSKVYITDLIQNYCMFNHQIITLIDNNTSNLSCIHRGKKRTDRELK